MWANTVLASGKIYGLREIKRFIIFIGLVIYSGKETRMSMNSR